MVHAEGKLTVRCATPSHGIVEPIRIGAVSARHSEHRPRPGQDCVCGADYGGGGVCRNPVAGGGRYRSEEGTLLEEPGRSRRGGAETDLATSPCTATSRVDRAMDNFGGRHASQPTHVPADTRTAHKVTDRRSAMLRSTARVARVVASRDASEIGMAVPVRTAAMKRSNCAC
jgi:hypothetical protein